MKCLRCGGYMVNEKYYGRGESFDGLKCSNCGDIIDSVILEHRKMTIEDQLALFKPRHHSKANKQPTVQRNAGL